MSWPVVITGHLNDEQATAIYCAACGWTGKQDDPGEGPISDIHSCPRCSLMTLDYCYEPGVACGGCGKIALDLPGRSDKLFWQAPHKPSCSIFTQAPPLDPERYCTCGANARSVAFNAATHAGASAIANPRS